MSCIMERLKQYKTEYSKYSKYDGLYVDDIMDMLEQLQDDLEQDEKRTGRLRTLSEIQEDTRTLTRVPSEFIHAKLDELANEIGELVNNQWIPVTERLPEEHNSIFAKFKGTPAWKSAMFEKVSPYVLATVKYEDGTALTEYAHTIDGKWKLENPYPIGEVIAWMPLPEPYKED